jgi:FKBP-type peptidyl-prolyl cis-trans isomerase FklB
MRKPIFAAVLLAAWTMLAVNGNAQQTPAATKPSASQPQTEKAPAAAPAKSEGNGPFKSREEKFSYALGMSIGTGLGQNLKKQSVDFDATLVSAGLKDSLAGGKTLITQEEAQDVLKQVQTEVQQKQSAKMKAESDKNKTDGDAFLAANKDKDGVVTLPSGLQYKILTEGTGPKPTPNDTVVCNYRGTLIDGKEFDSSYKRGNAATFPVKGVIKGWTEALQLMPVGSKWQLFVPANLAYGQQAMGADIPSNSTLIFEVELVSIQDKDKDKDKKDQSDKTKGFKSDEQKPDAQQDQPKEEPKQEQM